MKPLSRRQLMRGVSASVLAVLLAGSGLSFKAELAGHRERLKKDSQLVATKAGLLEYAEAGQGPPLFMIHGTGGGFDQGLLFGDGLRHLGHRIIAPSRFGYLKSSFPPDSSPARQADAFVELLDHLGIERLPVIGGSAGALSAAQFALCHPDRCSALILLVPAANVQARDPVEMTPRQMFVFKRLLGSDFLYWVLLKAKPDWLIGTLLATDPALVARASAGERARVRAILRTMLPISERTIGMIKDGQEAGQPSRIDFGAIRVPTLIISAEEDRFGTAETARWLAKKIPDARLKIFASGGHVWVGHDEEVARLIADHIAPNNSLIETKAKATELSATP